MKDAFRNRRDGITIPTIWIAVALSLLVHIAVLWKWLPQINLHLPSPEELAKRGETSGSLVVQLAPPPRPPSSPQSAPALQAQPAPPPKPAPPSRPAPSPRPSAPVLALRTPSTTAPPVPAPAPPAPPAPAPAPAAQPAPPRPPANGDFASMVEARQRARGEISSPASSGMASNAPAVEDDNARSNRIAAANLATQRRQTFGYDPSQGGGVFQITKMNYLNAEFLFFGWNKDIRRNTKQLIEVQKENNPDIHIAVVRKMISIIREYEQQDFLWESKRLGRNVTLSARLRDNAGLEEFLMHEFFDDPLRPPPG